MQPRAWQQMTRSIEGASNAYRNALASSGQFNVSQMRVNSQTEKYTELLQKQKLSMMDVRKNMPILRAAYREQLAMQKMVATSWGTDVRGRQVMDIAVPSQVSTELDSIHNRLGMIRAVTLSASTAMVNWGKNTQWAGRQLMVGFTMPVAALGAATGILAYQADREMTRIAKVYDTYSTNIASREREIAQLREDSMHTASTAAREYGAALQDTLSVQAELAATGLQGRDLQESTNQVMRIATLGELEHADATRTLISLQSILKLSTQDTADAFNYMNSIENATSLATQDFAKAIPVALGPIKEMGGDLQDLALLLVALKERGVQVGEGANAIKSMMQRLYRPSKQIRQEWETLANVDLTQIVKGANGNIMEILPQISNAVENLGRAERIQLLGGLFGTYQVTRLNAILGGLQDVRDEVGQVSRVREIDAQGWQKWAATADREIGAFQESASGKFKIALESIKVSLAEMGEPFLEIGSTILGWLTKLIDMFNKLPDSAKKGLAIAAIIAAIVGPVVMLTGLFANFIGTIAKVLVNIATLGNKFELLNREQAAGRLAAKMAEASFLSEGAAIQHLASEMNALTLSMKAAQAEQTRLTSGALMPNNIRANREAFRSGNLGGLQTMPVNTAFLPPAAAAADDLEGSTRQSKSHLAEMAVSGLAFSGAMIASAASSNEQVDKWANYAMIVAGVAPMLTMMGPALKAGAIGAAGIATNLKNAALSGGGLMGRTKSVASFLRAGMTSGLGIGVALAGAAVGAYALYKHMNAAAEEAEKTYSDASGLAEIYGFAEKEIAQVVNKQGELEESRGSRVQAMREEYGGLVDKIKEAKSDQDKFNYAMMQGLKVINSGGTQEQARMAVVDALTAAEGYAEAQRITLKFDARLDFSNAENVMNEQIQTATVKAQDAANLITKRVRASMEENMFTGALESTVDYLNDELTFGQWEKHFGSFATEGRKEAEKAGKAAGESYSTALQQALQTGNERGTEEVLTSMRSQVKHMNDQIKQLEDQGASAEEIANIEAVRNSIAKEFLDIQGATSEEIDVIVNGMDSGLNLLKVIQATNIKVSDEMWKQVISNQKNKDIFDTVTLAALTLKGYHKENTGEIGNQNKKLTEQERRVSKISKALQEHDWGGWAKGIMEDTQQDVADILTSDFEGRMERDLAATEAAGQRRLEAFDAEVDRRKEALEREGERLEEQQQAQGERLQRRQERQNEAMRLRQEREGEELDRQQQRQTETLERRQDSEMRRFENRWENRMDRVSRVYDNRIEKINSAIDAERQAEEIRQRIFDAEMRRVQRLAESLNRNIDFNIALNSGDLDEAARIQNDMRATEAEWSLEDAGRQGQGASDRRITALEARIEGIEKERDARIKALERVMEKERLGLERSHRRQKAALERSHRIQKEALARRHRLQERALEKTHRLETNAMEKLHKAQKRHLERERKALDRQAEHRRKQLDREVKATLDAERKKWNARKRNFDRAIKEFQAFVPRNERELRRHIARVSKNYKDFGRSVTRQGNSWGRVIGNTLERNVREAKRKLVSDMNWEAAGMKAARGMIRGAFDMNLNQFKRWVATGKEPKDWGGKKSNKPVFQGITYAGQKNWDGRHEGGPVGGGSSSRTGYSRSSAPMPSERLILAKNDEYVVKGNAVRKYGLGFMNKVNKGELDDPTGGKSKKFGTGGPGDLGMMGVMGIGMGAILRAALETSAISSAADTWNSMMAAGGTYSAAKAGVYGGTAFNSAQLKNAATIASVGSQLGASRRDIIIALMTAMQESTLRNLSWGDRDSVGLFQQRNAWGSFRDRTTPEKSARMFFLGGAAGQRGLFDFPDRDSMGLAEAAQSVQVSAFPSAYAKWADEARAILGGMKRTAGGGYIPGGGGWSLPVRGRKVGNTHGSSPGTDIGVPTGTPVRSVYGGTVLTSRDLRGYEPRAPHGGLGYRSYGRYIVMGHNFGGQPGYSLYAHLSRRGVRTGQQIPGGSTIGYSGNTGNSTGPHLHFEVGHGRSGASYPGSFLQARGLPALRDGGFTMSDGLAKLHKDETVMTAPLTDEFKRGVRQFADGGNVTYDIDIDARGLDLDEDRLADKIITKIQFKESRVGRRRRIG